MLLPLVVHYTYLFRHWVWSLYIVICIHEFPLYNFILLKLTFVANIPCLCKIVPKSNTLMLYMISSKKPRCFINSLKPASDFLQCTNNAYRDRLLACFGIHRGRFNGLPLLHWPTRPLGGWALQAPGPRKAKFWLAIANSWLQLELNCCRHIRSLTLYFT